MVGRPVRRVDGADPALRRPFSRWREKGQCDGRSRSRQVLQPESRRPRGVCGAAIERIRRLDPLLIDRIAAGEVIERPAAAVKELVENALDAGARRIEVAIAAGGRDLIRVSDDGFGMDAADLELGVERHATSKMPDGDLDADRHARLSRRGAALDRLGLAARDPHAARAARRRLSRCRVEDGAKGELEPCAHPEGTRIEARDLFAATPARLKFLKTDRAEAQACADVVRRLALAHPARALRVRQRDRRRRSTGRPAARASRRTRAAAPGARRRIRRQRAARRRDARGRRARRLGRPARPSTSRTR